MKSIRARLLLMLLPGILLALVFGGAAVYWITRASLSAEIDARLATRMQALVSLVAMEHGTLVFDFDDEPTEIIADCHFEFRNPAGEVLRRSNQMGDTVLALPVLQEGEMVFEDVLLADHGTRVQGRAVWLTFLPQIDNDVEDKPAGLVPIAKHEPLVAVLAVQREQVDEALRTIVWVLIGVGLAIATSVGLLLAGGVAWGLRPLAQLSREIGGVNGEDMIRRFHPAITVRELTPVYEALNLMLDRIEQTVQRERTFASAAAHELRTPLAELRTTAEVAVKWPDQDQACQALHTVLEIGRDMERLVEALLLMNQSESLGLKGSRETVDVAAVVHECLRRQHALVLERGLRVTVSVGEKAGKIASAPLGAIEIIVRNLIDNAIRYTQTGGDIVVSNTLASGEWAALLVENGPVALKSEDVAHLFEPFWRGDAAHTDRTHVGLGLTIVQRVASLIGLRVEAKVVGDRLRIGVFEENTRPSE